MVSRQGFDYLPVSTGSDSCPHVVHRFIHRMTASRAQLKVIHNPQVRVCVWRLSVGFSSFWGLPTASYPQAEVIHRLPPLWNSPALWTTTCPQGGGRPVAGGPDTDPGAPSGRMRTGDDWSDLTSTRPGRIFFMLMPLILPALVCVHPHDVAATANAP